MAIVPYIILATSDGTTKVKRFKTTELTPMFRRTDTVDFTAGGKMDKQAGISYWVTTYTIRVPDDVSDADYGTKDDLEYFLELNNPHGAVTDMIKLTNHQGDQSDVYILGDTPTSPIMGIFESNNAYFFYKVTFIKKV